MTDAELRNLRRRVNRARNFPINTCPASRCLHMMANDLLRYGRSHRLHEEPREVAEDILVVLEKLWKSTR